MLSVLTLTQLLEFYDSPKYAPVEKFSNWFPIYPSEELAEVVGFLIGDGHIQGKPKWRIDFTSNKFDTLNYFNWLIFNLFEINGKIRKCSTNKYNTYNLGINSKPLARVLFLCGVPVGAKVEKTFLVPNWILDDKFYFRAFIRSYFSCEACVDKDGAIVFEQWKLVDKLINGKQFLNQIKCGLNIHFKIFSSGPYEMGQSNKTKKGITKGLRLKIRRKQSLKEYYSSIGFVDNIKQLKLKKLISDY